MRQYENASVSVFTEKDMLSEGSYRKEAVLLYPGQYQVAQDAGTRDDPVIVTQRVIKQAIKVTKDIAEDSYKDTNTYKIHRDPFTVLSVSVSYTHLAKEAKANINKENLMRLHKQGKYVGKITDVYKGTYFIHLNNGVNAVAHSCNTASLPGRKDEVG